MIHIIPVNDIEIHTTNTSCECQPIIDGDIVTHCSYDGREADEEKAGRAAEGKHWTIITL